jgi:hypothetical protein
MSASVSVREAVCSNPKSGGTHVRRAHQRSDCARPMSAWHREWQAEFPAEFQECYLSAGAAAGGEPGRKKRTADVKVGRTVVEFQHSGIGAAEVAARTADLESHGAAVWWVVDVTAIDATTAGMRSAPRLLPIGEGAPARWLLHVPAEAWKTQSFGTAVYDCGAAGLFLVPVAAGAAAGTGFRCGMREVQHPVSRAEFVRAVNRGVSPFVGYEIAQTTLYRCQMGAGNGKTWNAVRLFDDPRFKYKSTFLFVTKAHSARETLLAEFVKQFPAAPVVRLDRKAVARLAHTDGRQLTFAFATVDSLIHQVMRPGAVPRATNSPYEDKVVHVGRSGIGQNTLRYCGSTIRLDKEALVVGDEMQDLPTFYLEAFVMIARETLVDVWLIGDRLQSLGAERNAFTQVIDAGGLPHAQSAEETPPVNECRRFGDKHRDFVNGVIDFGRFGVPRITLPADFTCKFPADQTVTVVEMPWIPKELSEKTKDLLDVFCDNVLEIFERESGAHGCLPEDFLVVTPFVKCRMAVALTDRVNAWWQARFETAAYRESVRATRARRGQGAHPLLAEPRTCEYCRFHQSVPERPVDTSTSVDSTRVVSVHSAKGDGREVVIALNITESALTCHAESGGLQYTSMLHVALTRQERALYVYAGKNEPLAVRLRAAQFGDVDHPSIQADEDAPFFKHEMATCETKDPPLAVMPPRSREIFSAFVDAAAAHLAAAAAAAPPSAPGAVVEYEHHEIRYACMIHQTKLSLDREGVRTPKRGNQTQGQFGAVAGLAARVLDTQEYWTFVMHQQHERDRALARQEVPSGLPYVPLQRASRDSQDAEVGALLERTYAKVRAWARAYGAGGAERAAAGALAPRDVVLLCHAIWTSKYYSQNPIRPAAVCELFKGARGQALSRAHYAATHDVDTSVVSLLGGMRAGGREVTALFDHKVSVRLMQWELKAHLRFALENGRQYAIVAVVPSLDAGNLAQVLGNAVLATLAVLLELADRRGAGAAPGPGPAAAAVPGDVRVAVLVGSQTAPVYFDCQPFLRAHLSLVVRWITDHFLRVNASSNQRLQSYVQSADWCWGELADERRFSAAQREVLADVQIGHLPKSDINATLHAHLVKSLAKMRALIFARLAVKDTGARGGE